MEGVLKRTRRPDVTFSPSGRIDISARVADILDLRRGDVVGVGTERGEWYLYVVHRAPTVGRHEGQVYLDNRGGRRCRAWSRRTALAVLDACGERGRTRLAVGEPEPHPVYGTVLPIITGLEL